MWLSCGHLLLLIHFPRHPFPPPSLPPFLRLLFLPLPSSSSVIKSRFSIPPFLPSFLVSQQQEARLLSVLSPSLPFLPPSRPAHHVVPLRQSGVQREVFLVLSRSLSLLYTLTCRRWRMNDSGKGRRMAGEWRRDKQAEREASVDDIRDVVSDAWPGGRRTSEGRPKEQVSGG